MAHEWHTVGLDLFCAAAATACAAARHAVIRGHVFCSFLELVLGKELKDRCAAADLKPEWDRLIRDFDRLQSGDDERDCRTIRELETRKNPII